MVIEYIGNDFLTYLPCDTMTNKLFEQHTTLVHDNYANFLMKNELKQILGCIYDMGNHLYYKGQKSCI